MEFVIRAYPQLLKLYRSMTPGSRRTAALLAAVALLSLGYLGMRGGAEPDVDLMHGVPVTAAQLPLMEAAFAKANLTGYEIKGTSIRVPRGQESAYMNALVEAKALPPNFGAALNGAIGSGNFLASEHEREERMKIAKQEELALAIRAMPGIETAYVLYDIDNKPGGFKEKVITATVSVKPSGSAQLEEPRVSAIRHYVAGAIAGLKPENVTVADLNGRTWYGNLKESAGAEAAFRPTLTQTDTHEPRASSQNIAAHESPRPASGQDAWNWIVQSPWNAIGLIALAVVGLLALRSMVRPKPPAVDGPAKSVATALDKDPTGAKPAKLPPPHWRRHSAAETPLREELSKLVEDDPETAANILRNWIGQVD
jgi:flagellar biosynthesis/type III secretory pathway M-ring protein FliF/YscJ